jgi:hypothetical protein
VAERKSESGDLKRFKRELFRREEREREAAVIF